VVAANTMLYHRATTAGRLERQARRPHLSETSRSAPWRQLAGTRGVLGVRTTDNEPRTNQERAHQPKKTVRFHLRRAKQVNGPELSRGDGRVAPQSR